MSHTVRMYTLSTCSHCKNAKRFMDQHRIQYNFTDVDLLTGDARTSIMDEVRKYNPKCTFPTILVGEKVIIGFNESALRGVLEQE